MLDARGPIMGMEQNVGCQRNTFRPRDLKSWTASLLKLNYFQSDRNADSALRRTSSHGRMSGGEQRRYGWRRAAVLGRLFVTVANLDQ